MNTLQPHQEFTSPYSWQRVEEPLYQEHLDPHFKTRWGKVLQWMGFKSPNDTMTY